jgi:hypothetical protein
MGTKVYRGRHADGREVAVKAMDQEVVPEHRARREMQLLHELTEERPSMVQVLEHPLFWSEQGRFRFLCFCVR